MGDLFANLSRHFCATWKTLRTVPPKSGPMSRRAGNHGALRFSSQAVAARLAVQDSRSFAGFGSITSAFSRQGTLNVKIYCWSDRELHRNGDFYHCRLHWRFSGIWRRTRLSTRPLRGLDALAGISTAISFCSAILGGYVCVAISRCMRACQVLALIVLILGIILCLPKMHEDPPCSRGRRPYFAGNAPGPDACVDACAHPGLGCGRCPSWCQDEKASRSIGFDRFNTRRPEWLLTVLCSGLLLFSGRS